MRVIIAGDRGFADREKAFWALDYWSDRIGISSIVTDGHVTMDVSERSLPEAQRRKWGASYLAKEWAQARRVPVIEERILDAELKKHGMNAAALRHQRAISLHRPDLALSLPFRGGDAELLLDVCRKACIRCIEVA